MELAQRFVDKYDNVADMGEAMVMALEAEPALYRLLGRPLIEEACKAAARNALRHIRQNLQAATSGETQARVVALSSGVAMSLLDWPLPGGKRLRDATREEVLAAAEFYRAQAATMATTAKWLSAIAASVPNNRTVGAVLSSDRLRALKMQVEK